MGEWTCAFHVQWPPIVVEKLKIYLAFFIDTPNIFQHSLHFNHRSVVTNYFCQTFFLVPEITIIHTSQIERLYNLLCRRHCPLSEIEASIYVIYVQFFTSVLAFRNIVAGSFEKIVVFHFERSWKGNKIILQLPASYCWIIILTSANT